MTGSRFLLLAIFLALGCTGQLEASRSPSDGGRGAGSDAHVSPDAGGGGGGECMQARRLWHEDFETGTYERWTSATYNGDWGPESGGCRETGFSTEQAHGGTRSHRSAIQCPSHTDVHRGYGGVEFDGDRPEPAYTNAGTGIDAPHGVVVTFWRWLDVPYDFGGGRWLSLFTVNTDCGWSERVVTLGLDQPSRVLSPAHTDRNTFEPDAPAFPLRQWVRVTVYVNAHSGELHVWQDGQSLVHATFARPSTDLCQFHWGAYASGDNDGVVLFEDDQSVWRLAEPWTDMRREPWLDGDVPACE
ncbi:MAG: hypothetical protein RLP09_16090 [Sandaracinaceae bacterium]